MTHASAHDLAIRLADHPHHLRLEAQPIVDVRAGTVGGYELLTRLPDAWHIQPEELFAAADAAGVSARISAHVLRRPSTCETRRHRAPSSPSTAHRTT